MTFLNCVLTAFGFVWGVAASAAFIVIAINAIKSDSYGDDFRKVFFGMIANTIYLAVMYVVAHERFLCFIARWRRSIAKVTPCAPAPALTPAPAPAPAPPPTPTPTPTPMGAGRAGGGAARRGGSA